MLKAFEKDIKIRSMTLHLHLKLRGLPPFADIVVAWSQRDAAATAWRSALNAGLALPSVRRSPK